MEVLLFTVRLKDIKPHNCIATRLREIYVPTTEESLPLLFTLLIKDPLKAFTYPIYSQSR